MSDDTDMVTGDDETAELGPSVGDFNDEDTSETEPDDPGVALVDADQGASADGDPQAIQSAEQPQGGGLWATMRPLAKGMTWRATALAGCSLATGLAEASLLAVLANLALQIGNRKGASADLGVLGSLGTNVGQLFAIAGVLTFLRLAFDFASAHLSSKMAAILTQRIREGTFADYAAASWSVQAAEPESAIQDLLLRHVSKAQGAVVAFSNGIATVCMLISLIAAAFLVDPLASVLVVVAGAVLFLLLRPLTAYSRKLAERQRELGLTYIIKSREAIDFSLELRAFGVTDEVTAQLAEATRREIVPSYQAGVVSKMIGGIYSLASVLILLGGLMAVNSFLDRPLASLGAVVIILIRALNQGGTFQGLYHTLSEALPYIHRLDSERARFRASKPPGGTVELEVRRSLTFEHVTYSYTAGRKALADVSFVIDPGEAIGVVGPSGSGKSTLIQLLLRLRHPSAGRFLVGDTPAADIDNNSWFDQVAFVPQDCRVFDDSVRENIRFYRPDVTDEAIEQAARRAHVHDEIMAMPDGYDTRLGSRGGALSGGQRQRVAIARALVRQPSILVLDEPTSALDMKSEALVHQTLEKLKGSMTLVIIAHRLSTLNTCDRIMVFGEGHLQAFGSREELERDNTFYRQALALSQIRS